MTEDVPAPAVEDFAAEIESLHDLVRGGEEEATDVGAAQFIICVLYNGRPWQTLVFEAHPPMNPVSLVEQLVNFLNERAAGKGFPPLFTIQLGACPV